MWTIAFWCITLGRVPDGMHHNAEPMWKGYKKSQDSNMCRLLHFDVLLWVDLQTECIIMQSVCRKDIKDHNIVICVDYCIL